MEACLWFAGLLEAQIANQFSCFTTWDGFVGLVHFKWIVTVGSAVKTHLKQQDHEPEVSEDIKMSSELTSHSCSPSQK